MTPKKLKEKGGIYFEKIQNGMDEYPWESQFFSPVMAERYLRRLWAKNGDEGSFVDCYYPFLEKESQERVLSVLEPGEQKYLKQLKNREKDLILPLDEQILSIAVKLIDKEMLFFTFYFTKTPCTIWGNYKQEYLIFKRKERTNQMRIFAHRGFSGEYPENTMLSFQKAYETGCDGIELDVQLTKDDVIVIMHDERIDRTTNGKGFIRDYTYEELCRFDCCGKFPGMFEFQKIPTLREYFEWVREKNLVTNIELKNSVYYYRGLEEKVIRMVQEFHLEERVLFSSFNLVSMIKCKEQIPEIPMGFLLENRVDNMGWFAKDCGMQYYHPDKEFLTRDQVEDCHDKGIGVNVWTVNKKQKMKELAEWNVDGIFTNYPDKAMKLRETGII